MDKLTELVTAKSAMSAEWSQSSTGTAERGRTWLLRGRRTNFQNMSQNMSRTP